MSELPRAGTEKTLAKVRVCIGVVTRDRPTMARNLLASLEKLQVPSNHEILIVLVENGPTQHLAEYAGSFHSGPTISGLSYIHETSVGVVNARNRALGFALDHSFDRLAFIDDDEIADAQWLQRLVAEMDLANANLVGGPVRPFVRIVPKAFWQRVIWRGYRARCRHLEAKANFYRRFGLSRLTTLATNNWMVDVGFCHRHALRFDPQFNLTGGEDSDFFRLVLETGGHVAWVPSAIAYEEVPAERLSFAYQFTRARDQSLVTYHRKHGDRRIFRYPFALLSAAFSSMFGLAFLLLVPLTFGRTLYQAARKFGAASGRIGGLLGQRTSHYAKMTGY
jgi:cellulose synthase/poly-beta-1,6-N-acetylglucosamine synthase-like glycosyltransferase